MALTQLWKYHLKLMPEGRVAFAERYAEVDGVWERMIPVRPVVWADGVIAADVSVERPHEHNIRVDVYSSVLYHEVDAPDVRHMRQHVDGRAVDLRTSQKLLIMS